MYWRKYIIIIIKMQRRADNYTFTAFACARNETVLALSFTSFTTHSIGFPKSKAINMS
jgi:hypothetical protein